MFRLSIQSGINLQSVRDVFVSETPVPIRGELFLHAAVCAVYLPA